MMHLGFSLSPFGHDPLAWQQGGSREALGFPALLDQVLRAEKAGFDFVLLSDRLTQRPTDALSPLAVPFEPTTLVSALATKARKIGFLAAAGTDQHEPYNLARRLASMDWVNHGRTGWTVVGGADQARDEEYVDVVSALWDSWEDDAFIYDKAKSRFFVPEKMHVLNHKGRHFSVRGPLNVNRSPQGKPVLAQILGGAGAHPASNKAEVLFVEDEAIAALLSRHLVQSGRRRSDFRVIKQVREFIDAPSEMADTLERALAVDGPDGFLLLPPTIPSFFKFLDAVVPELQRRGLVRREHAGTTLREHLRLPFPVHPASLERAT